MKNKTQHLGEERSEDINQGDELSDNTSDLELGGGVGGGFFTTKNITLLKHILQDVALPTGVGKLPKHLGASKNGRFKASDWLKISKMIIPLIVLEMFFEGDEPISPKPNQGKFLQNTGDLVQCTRVVRDGHAGRLSNAYSRYTGSSKQLLNNSTVNLSHHYALHIPQQLKFWVPFFSVAEIVGEILIRIFQKNPKNN
ncbi:hypothetical protein O181_020043 [Austropuccinia psidii MF-1]|uniref:Uncharacterized protein n=1 Tax=Austropuccinia psidii MF-1 TaxID=1389203 RepID=A0A9Q3CC71_9BASI|nr:hypothetical protein [Austropuccinia psidii MF-1]